MNDKAERADMAGLLALPAFRKYLWRIIQASGIHAATTNGADGRNLISEGRRNLGLDMLRDAARGQPIDDPGNALTLTLIQVLSEEAQSTPAENQRGRRTDRYSDESDA